MGVHSFKISFWTLNLPKKWVVLALILSFLDDIFNKKIF